MIEQRLPTGQSEDFEKWLRMATDNKINTQNSWNLSLIDYFHDLTFLKDGENVNFQKASATLDGCVKIYASRVDSAATETGKLINGLSNNNRKKNENWEKDQSDEENSDTGNAISSGTTKRYATHNVTKNTLVKFDSLKAKTGELEVYVDPLLKKSIADFDEGGSKSLLLNMLNINKEMKIALDTIETGETLNLGTEVDNDSNGNYLGEEIENHPDILTEPTEEEEKNILIDRSLIENHRINGDTFQEDNPESTMTEGQMSDFILENIGKLSDSFEKIYRYPNTDCCSSLAKLKSVMNNEGSIENLLRELEDMVTYDVPPIPPNCDVHMPDFSFDNGGRFDDDHNDHFPGDEKAVRISMYESLFLEDDEIDAFDNFGLSMRTVLYNNKSFVDEREATMIEQQNNDVMINLVTSIPNKNLLTYFDNNQRHNWAGPEHWKIQKAKRSFNFKQLGKDTLQAKQEREEELDEDGNPAERAVQKAKFTINFMSDLAIPDSEKVFAHSERPQLLRIADMTSKTHHKLPNDQNFTTQNFIRLFIKDQVIHSRFNNYSISDKIIDANDFAEATAVIYEEKKLNNANFFNDHNNHHYDDHYNDLGSDYYAYDDVQESQPTQPLSSSQRLQFSRVDKRLDVRLLKNKLWETLSQEARLRNTQELQQVTPDTSYSSQSTSDEVNSPPRKRQALLSPFEVKESIRFSNIVHDLSTKYDTNIRSNISTSFCFITLLHLANEKGFSIESIKDNTDLVIKDVPEAALVPQEKS